MFDLKGWVSLIVDQYRLSKDISKRNDILCYAILAEAKANNDLLNIICRAGINKVVQEYPVLFNNFSTSTSDILIATGVPAYIVFGEKDMPQEDNISMMDKQSIDWLDKKKSSELYEFCMRKCHVLKTLSTSKALDIPRISIAKRCTNLSKATRILIDRLS